MSDITGTIRIIGKTESFGANGFTKRQIIVDTDDQYSQSLPIDFVKDKCALLDNYKPGDQVAVSYNLRGNEYNGKFYCSIQGWKINRQDGQQSSGSAVDDYKNRQQTQTSPQEYRQDNYQPASSFREEEHDDLPF